MALKQILNKMKDIHNTSIKKDKPKRVGCAVETNRHGDNIHVSKLRGDQLSPVSTSSTTSFCSCCNGIKPTKSTNKTETSDTIPLTMTNKGNDPPVSKKYVSLGCQTNLGKEIIVELAVYHGGTKVVSENFEFPHSVVTDKTMLSGKAFEIYYEIVNDEMLQVWGVEKKIEDDKNDKIELKDQFVKPRTHQVDIQKEHILKNLQSEAEEEKVQAMVLWAKAQTEKCKSVIMNKYDEIWTMLDSITIEAINDIVAKEKELMDLIEEVVETEINVVDYKDVLSNIN